MLRTCDIMAVCMARLIREGETVFHGVSSHLPLVAVQLAKSTHAPHAVHLNIPGGVDPQKTKLLSHTSAGDDLWQTGEAAFALSEVFDLSMRGGLDVAFLSGVQFDNRSGVNAGKVVVFESRHKCDSPCGYYEVFRIYVVNFICFDVFYRYPFPFEEIPNGRVQKNA